MTFYSSTAILRVKPVDGVSRYLLVEFIIMVTSEKEQDATRGSRIYFLDNLRTFMIFVVVLLHAGIVYENSGTGAYYWIVDDPSTNDLSGTLNLIIDIFVMPIMFFVAGFFTPLSINNKKGWAFLKSKFKRIIIPWIIAVLTLIPLYKMIFLYSRNLPQETWTAYFHFSNGIISQGWLWFLPVLFLFNVLYLLFLKGGVRISNISLRGVVFGIFLIGFVYSVSMDTFGLQGWTKIGLLDFQNERILIYFMFYLLGSLCFKQKIFESKPTSKKLYIAVSCTAWIPTSIYVILVVNKFVNPGSFIFSELVDRLLLWFGFHLSLLSMLYVAVNTFRFYLYKQGRIRRILSENSYNVYIIHPIVIGGIALTMLNTAIPSLLKYLILTVSSYCASNLIIYFCRKLISQVRISIGKICPVPDNLPPRTGVL